MDKGPTIISTFILIVITIINFIKMQILGIPGTWQILMILIILVGLLLPIIALIDILRNEFTGSNKIIWVLVVIFLPLFGTLLYFVIGTQQKIK